MGKFGGDWRWGSEKLACWRTKAAISLKRVKIGEKLLWTTYRNSPTLFRTVPSPTLYILPFLQIGGLQLSYPLLSQEQVKLYRLQIWQVHLQGQLDKSPLKILEKRERGRIQGLPKFFWVPPIISGTGKATDFKFWRNIHRVDQNKSP